MYKQSLHVSSHPYLQMCCSRRYKIRVVILFGYVTDDVLDPHASRGSDNVRSGNGGVVDKHYPSALRGKATVAWQCVHVGKVIRGSAGVDLRIWGTCKSAGFSHALDRFRLMTMFTLSGSRKVLTWRISGPGLYSSRTSLLDDLMGWLWVHLHLGG